MFSQRPQTGSDWGRKGKSLPSIFITARSLGCPIDDLCDERFVVACHDRYLIRAVNHMMISKNGAVSGTITPDPSPRSTVAAGFALGSAIQTAAAYHCRKATAAQARPFLYDRLQCGPPPRSLLDNIRVRRAYPSNNYRGRRIRSPVRPGGCSPAEVQFYRRKPTRRHKLQSNSKPCS